MNKKLIKKLNILMLALTLTLSGCGNSNKNTLENQNISYEYNNELDNDEKVLLKTDNYIVLNEYEDYKQYLTNPEPTYEELYSIVKQNKNISKEYKEVFYQIIELFKTNKIESKNLGVFYENLMKLNLNLNFIVDNNKNNKVAAFFIPDPDHPTINIDPTCIDFYTFLHETIHSCKELQIRHENKIIYITSQKYQENNGYIELSGNSFSEAQAEWISRYLSQHNERLFISSDSYNTNNNIFEFMIDTLDIDYNKAFAFNVDTFINELINLGIQKKDANNILNEMDNTLNNKESNINELRYLFYSIYIPKLVEYYINQELTTQEIYSKIGYALKFSIIEEIKDNSEIIYRETFLNSQKEIFDYTNELINKVLISHNMETSSIYYYIGHEFEIYYSLYGDEVNKISNNYYLAHNWDEVATENCNILLYVENNMIKMCAFAENNDGSLSCYDYNNELTNINNGIKLADLLKDNIISIENGYLYFNFPIESIIKYIENCSINCSFKKSIVNLSDDRYFYISDSHGEICNITINAEGEIIPYHILSNQLYLLPENALKIASVNELYNEGILTYDENDNINIDSEKLTNYINKHNIKNKKR